MKLETVNVKAPFDMPLITVADFSDSPVFNIVDFGAIANDTEATSNAITRAIKQASEQGGGTVLVPAGEWLCKTIHLQSFVNLHIADDAILVFSERPEDYLPAVKTTWEGMECYNYSPLIYAYQCSHIAITGRGKLQAKLDVWRLWFERPAPHMNALASLYHLASKNVAVEQRQMVFEGANLRPHFVQFNRCKHCLIEDISIQDSPFWVLHPFLCSDVIIRRVKVVAHGHNNDGVDPEMTQNMLIEDCIFDQGDDAISVKAGRNLDGWRLGTPTRNVVMRNCRIARAHQLLAVGSELSAGIENILIENCVFEDGNNLLSNGFGNVVLVKTNERRGGFVRNIFVRSIQARSIAGGALCVDTDVLYQWRDLVPTYERRLTQIEGLYLENVTIGAAKYLCKIDGQTEAPVRNVVLSNVQSLVLSEPALQNVNVEGFKQQ